MELPLLIAARFCQGASAAVTRVLVMAMVRDLFEAEAMAKVMSLVSMVFMVMPVLAPNIGQLIFLFGTWRLIFLVLAAYGALMLGWSGMRLPRLSISNTAARSILARSARRWQRPSPTRSRAATPWR